MPLRLHIPRADEAPGKKTVISSKLLRSETVAQPAPGATLVRQAQRESSALTSSAVLRLQRVIGNHAVSQVIAATQTRRLAEDGESAARRLPADVETIQRESETPLVQRAKTEKQRSEKHRRVARARQTILLLGNNLKPKLDAHIFQATPIDGGRPDPNAPTGLHAYTDGKLPTPIEAVKREGSLGGVHKLTWRWRGRDTEKSSTMFPIWMPPEHVRTLIALKYPETRAHAVDETKIYPDYTRTYILRGQNIRIDKSGNTVYPVI